MKRLTVLLAFVLALSLAVPASAATWRTYANVRADRGYSAYAGGAAANTTDIQLGIYSYGKGRYVDWDAGFTCWNGYNHTSRSKSGKKWVPAGEWRYILIRDASSQSDECNVDGWVTTSNYNDTGAIKLALRVR